MSPRSLLALLVLLSCRPVERDPGSPVTQPSSVYVHAQPPASAPTATRPDFVWVYVGSYAGSIQQYRLDLSTGELTPLHKLTGLRRPSALVVHPSQRRLYAVDDSASAGIVNAFAIDPTDGALTLINSRPSHGAGPTHISIDNTGGSLLVANYNSGSVSVLPIQPDGGLGEATSTIKQRGKSIHPKRQSSPHAHYIHTDPQNRFALIPDLGTDLLLVYQFNAVAGSLSEHTSAAITPGSGPRHLSFHPDGRFVYLLNELKSTITTFAYEEGALTERNTTHALPSSRTGCCAASIVTHPSGGFLYSSNRGHDSIAIFSIEKDAGVLNLISHQKSGGKTPRNIGIDPSGAYLLVSNQSSGSLVVFGIDKETGLLSPVQEPIAFSGAAGIEFVSPSLGAAP